MTAGFSEIDRLEELGVGSVTCKGLACVCEGVGGVGEGCLCVWRGGERGGKGGAIRGSVKKGNNAIK